jgi:hypothetical protein
VLTKIYKDLGINSKMHMSNESFKLQNQNHIMIVPIEGKLCMRVLRNHHLDSIDDPTNPDRPLGYVISQVDKNEVRRSTKAGSPSGRYDSYTNTQSDHRDQSIGDADDFNKRLQRYVVWTEQFNFIMNGHGEIILEEGDEITNPIGMVPIIDISIEKDFEYWVRQGDSLTDFTVEFNALLSDISQVVRMQGYAQAYLIAKDDLIPANVQVGPNYVLKLPMEEGSTVKPEFGFANPGADLAGTIQFAEMRLATFLTSRNQDVTTVSGSGQVSKASSGIEKMLQMIEQFEASRTDFDTYARAEGEVYEIIKAWHNVSLGNDLLDRSYQSTNIPMESELVVKFSGPEMVVSQSEKIDIWTKRIEAGEATVIDMMMDIRGVDQGTAIKLLQENESLMVQLMPPKPVPPAFTAPIEEEEEDADIESELPGDEDPDA